MGIQVPPTTSGPDTGPGCYPGKEIPAIRVKSPTKLSVEFMHNRVGLDVLALNSNLDTLRPRFHLTRAVANMRADIANANAKSDPNVVPFKRPVGFTFSVDRNNRDSVHRRMQSRKRMNKIYPAKAWAEAY